MTKILFLNSAPIIKHGMKIGFEKAGWETDMLSVSEQNIEGFKSKVDTFKPDYVLIEGGINCQNWIIPVVKEKGLKLIYWAIEDPVWVNSLSMEYGRESVLVATTDADSISTYDRAGIKAITVPFAIDPDFYYFRGISEKYANLDALFVGNNYNYYPTRIKAYKDVIQPFIDLDKNLEVYGMDWDNPEHQFNVPSKYVKGYMPHDETPIAYSSAKIVLGVHSVVNSPTMQSMRTFEVLGCRGFFLTAYAKSLEVMFKNHEHLVISSSPEETVELMNFYLPREDLRNKIALQGQEFVYQHHTYELRAKDIIRALGE